MDQSFYFLTFSPPALCTEWLWSTAGRAQLMQRRPLSGLPLNKDLTVFVISVWVERQHCLCVVQQMFLTEIWQTPRQTASFLFYGKQSSWNESVKRFCVSVTGNWPWSGTQTRTPITRKRQSGSSKSCQRHTRCSQMVSPLFFYRTTWSEMFHYKYMSANHN